METKKKTAVFVSILFFLCFSGFNILFSQEENDSAVTDNLEQVQEESEPAFDIVQNRYGGITIIRYRGKETSVEIPQTIDGQPVTIIGNKAFYSRSLTKAIIPDTVHTIEPLAFAENLLQSAVVLGCVSIGYEAFAGNQLEEVVFSDKLTSIGPRSFYNNKLSSIAIPGAITNIGKDAFAKNPLASITVAQNRNLFSGQGFELSFVNFYISMGRRAGVYVKNGRVWNLMKNEE